jgi:ESCRT-I complex subunit TSG101
MANPSTSSYGMSYQYGAYPPSAQPPQPPQPPQTPYPPVSTNSVQFSGDPNTATITQEHIKASLVSAVEDKIRRLLRDEYATKQVEMESLKKIRDELNEKQRMVKGAIDAMNKHSSALDTSTKQLQVNLF